MESFISRINGLKDYQKNLFAGIISFLIVFLFLAINNITIYWYDSDHYFMLSNLFIGGDYSDSFSILNYPLTLRGIIYPLLLFPFNLLSTFIYDDSLRGNWFLISLLSGLFSISFNRIFKSTGKIVLLPVPLLLLLFVFYGLFLYPLSDLGAVFFLSYALALIAIAYDTGNSGCLKPQKLGIKQIVLFIIAGVMLYASYNIRSVYLFAIPCIIFILFSNRKVFRKSFFIPIAILTGVFILGGIQGISNLHTMGTFSIVVPSMPYGYQESLFLSGLYQGVKYHYGELFLYPMPTGVNHLNSSGMLMLQAEGIEVLTYREYIKLLIKYPIEMLGIYTRHLITLLNPIQGSPYRVAASTNMRFVYTLFNYSALFIVTSFTYRNYLWVSFKELRSRFNSSSLQKKICFYSLFAFLLPSLSSVLMHGEARYAVSLWIMVYGLLCYVISMKTEFKVYKQRPLSYAIVYVIGFAVFTAILTEMYANNDLGLLMPILRLR